MGSNLNLTSTCEEIENRLPSMEYVLGKGLLQPFGNTNSGTRKIMQGIQKEQGMQLEKAETPIIMTGFENQFGELSSTFVRADRDLVVIDKIPKYDLSLGVKNANYWLICLDPENGVIDALERIDYRHISESYGFRMDTAYMDNLDVSSPIPKGTPIIKSNSYDCANNKCDGVNLTTVYMALAETTEDPIVLSESSAKKFSAPLFDTVKVQINDNDILLNLYGKEDGEYKTFPDIGEEIENGMLCGVRREHKDAEALYAQSWERLKDVMISDDKYTLKGKIIDINIYCNNPEKLESSVYNAQIAKYYNMNLEFCRAVVKSMSPLISRGLTLTYEAEKLYYKCKDTLDGKQYINDKVFNNIVMEIVTMEMKPLCVGDKITDRHGGKGVVSEIWEDWRMPKYKEYNGGTFRWTPVEAIYDNSTVVNRENPGQSYETEISHAGSKIIERICMMFDRELSQIGTVNVLTLATAEEMIYKFYEAIAPEQAHYFLSQVNYSTEESRWEMMNSILCDGAIYLVCKPISCGMSIDKLRALYTEFPWIEQSEILVPQKGSNGEYRFIPARRKLVTGKKYIYRLKQFAEEKMSSVSLASTNIRSENTKSKANKLHKSVHATTPVRFGEMEFEDLMHMKVELVIQALMLLSSSPMGRRLNEQLLTGDPFVRDVRLDTDSTSRSVEIINAYLKTIGLKLVFEKIPKNKALGAVRNVVNRIPNHFHLNDIVDRVPAQIKDSILDIAKMRIVVQEEKSDLKNIVDRVPVRLGGDAYLARVYVDSKEIHKAVNEICQLAAEYNEPGEFKGHEPKEDMVKRVIDGIPKEKLLPVIHRVVVNRIK